MQPDSFLISPQKQTTTNAVISTGTVFLLVHVGLIGKMSSPSENIIRLFEIPRFNP